jgi:hypothetical protein
MSLAEEEIASTYLSEHKLALLTLAIMSVCPLGKNPILPQSLDYELSIQPP